MKRSSRQQQPGVWSSCRRQQQQQQQLSLGGGSSTTDSDTQPAPPQQHTTRKQRHLEGVLKKYTNLLHGWQSRYFVLDPEAGQLQYYLNEVIKNQRPPRGFLPLLGAMVVSSDEYQYMFTIKSTAGVSYKLRAPDAQQQELWMTQLQLCSRRHSDAKAMSPAEGQQKSLVNSVESLPSRRGPLSGLDEDLILFKASSAATLSCLGGCLSMLQHNVVQALNHNQNQNQNHITSLSPSHSSCGLSPSERGKPRSIATSEPGTLRSTGQSPAHGVQESPKHSRVPQNQSPGPAAADISTGRSQSPSERKVKNGAPPSSSISPPPSAQTDEDTDRLSEHHQQSQSSNSETPDPSEETTDTDDNEEEELGVQEEQRSIIIHLLSQLKLGMDLTRVVLPTFILEKRSLLEMYANFMAHPDMFLSITSGCTAEERIIRFVEYYLTAFHEGRKGAVAKKPYNPILGENFHCSWYVPRGRIRPLRTTNCPDPNSVPRSPQRGGGGGASRRSSDCYRVRFVAEQVSHHPPVSGFYCECKERRMCVNAHVWTKSKFMGVSVGVSMVGEGVLYLLEHDEEYVFTLPCAYARSILTVPWVELGGKVSINCAKSGYSATVTFHTKPFYGGKVHRVTAEVKQNQTGNVVCKAQGEWNGVLEFTYSSGENKVIDTSKLPIIKKKMRPLERQGQYESRRLWQHVTGSLKAGNMDAATEHKHFLEERQRSESKQRTANKTPWTPKYFVKEGEGWVYHNPLWKAH
ncbi:oxysterol-binding protein-related protein 10-like [Cheilinus undulatus]|uniref:oxysterol-binding protein-related protein 10-like n=1 Tax=Cheilinus undulatus TaxID=241271 RepID=UPI001BD32027|nr:oxysterol-binding protein-related protein 10-like [Cheilinus undulatus]